MKWIERIHIVNPTGLGFEAWLLLSSLLFSNWNLDLLFIFENNEIEYVLRKEHHISFENLLRKRYWRFKPRMY